ncbi:hypothetical protein [Orenia marismortui]|uniref:Uncharacterized protein n=1 Tax=Orenia marismortui TaxID=46469 RepID=A0A4R8H1C1_9FIRM|nr:hypothetical protein [Orenia marismortui]TDX48329.1 hypothetical protein C7959_13056 [Orenia marismortui]
MNLKERLLEALTSVYTKTQDSKIARFITLVTDQIDEIYVVKDKIKDSRNIETAFGETLDKIGEAVQQERGSLGDPTYRLLIKSKVARNRSTGDINTILTVMESMLDISQEDILLEENPGNEPASVYIEIPLVAVGQYNITREHFITILNRITAAGVRPYTRLNGTFEFSDGSPEVDNDAGFGDLNNPDTGGFFGSWHEPENPVELPDW